MISPDMQKRRKQLRRDIAALDYSINLFTQEAMNRAQNNGLSYYEVEINPGVEILKNERTKVRAALDAILGGRR